MKYKLNSFETALWPYYCQHLYFPLVPSNVEKSLKNFYKNAGGEIQFQ